MADTAATANTNPADDIARNAQTNSGIASTPLSAQEDKNVNAVSTEETPPAPKQLTVNAADETKKTAPTVVGGNSTNTSKEVANPLDAYPSYTYGLSLFALTKADYNNMVDNPNSFKPSKNLISSAGRYRNVRDKNFKEDFYFDSFKVTTVVGMNAASRSSNAITMEFNIIEPYGMTLLDRIMNVSMNELAAKNYLDIPYLLRLEFFGYDDQGNTKKLVEHTKNFPIKLISFKIKASVKGSEYAIQAVPFNHGANLESVQALKTRLEVTAATVGEFFSNSSDPKTKEDVDTFRQNQAMFKPTAGQATSFDEFGNPVVAGSTAATTAGVVAPPTKLNTSSFTAAYNAWNLSAVKTGDSKFADQIKFVIDKDIAGSKITDPKSTSVTRSGETTAQQESRASAGSKTPGTTLDMTKVVHSFEAGTTVNDIINAIIPNSEYFTKQVKDPSKDAKSQTQSQAASDSTVQAQAKPINIWKIVPSIKLKEFDSERNVWSKDITFHIGKYAAYQQRDPRLPKSPPPKAVKRYDYFYTGKNNSIISFDIDFNALYFTATQINRGNTETTAGTKASPDAQNKDGDTSVGGKSGLSAAERKVNTGSQMQTGVAGSNNKSETQNAQSALQSIYTSAAGDMISLKMQIIGDPHFIKQDDLFVVPNVSGSQDTFVSPQIQSLNMDSGEIYCYVTFKTPTDFNDATGMYNLNSSNQYSTSEFSGYYRVLLVDSEFRSGKFTQTLTLVRYPMQDSPNTSKTQGPTDNKRNDSASAPKLQGEQVKTNEDAETVANNTTTTPEEDARNTELVRAQFAANEAENAQTTEEADLSKIAASGPSTPIADATSSDGNTVPVQG